MTGLDIVTLPAELAGPPARMTALRLAAPAGGGEAVIVAGPLPRPGIGAGGGPGGFAVASLRAGWIAPLWAAARGSAAVRRADLVAAGGGKALLLLPRRAIVALDPFAEGARARLVARGRSLPVRLFAPDGTPVAVTLRGDGSTFLDRLDAEGAAHGDREAGPVLAPGQEPSLLIRDAAGRLVFGADDAVRGFQLWRAEAGEWRPLVTDGAARFGQNAAILDATVREERVILAVGPSETVRENLPGMPIRGEILAIDAAGRVGLVAGELRPSPAGLLVPQMGARALRDMAAEEILRLAGGPGLLVAAVRRAGGEVALCRIAGEGPAGAVLAALPGVPLALGMEAGGGIRALVAAPEAARAGEDADVGDDGEGDDDAPGDDDWAAFAAAIGDRD